MKIYGYGRNRSFKCWWTAAEVGIEVEPVVLDLALGEQRSESYLKLNPFGKVPTLKDGDFVLFEAQAIMLYLAEKDPEKRLLFAANTPEYYHMYQWVLSILNGLEQPIANMIKGTKIYTAETDPSEKTHQKYQELMIRNTEQAVAFMQVVEQEIEEKDYLVGDQFSLADLNLAYSLIGAKRVGILQDFSNLKRYLEAALSRQAFPAHMLGSVDI